MLDLRLLEHIVFEQLDLLILLLVLLLQGQVFLLLLVQQFTQLDLLLLDGPELLVVVEENALLQLDLSLEISFSGGV